VTSEEISNEGTGSDLTRVRKKGSFQTKKKENNEKKKNRRKTTNRRAKRIMKKNKLEGGSFFKIHSAKNALFGKGFIGVYPKLKQKRKVRLYN